MDLLQEAYRLSAEAASVTTAVEVPEWPKHPEMTNIDEQWPVAVAGTLHRANKLLGSIQLLLNPQVEDTASAVILLRNLFECTVNLAYIRRDKSTRLPQFIRHGAGSSSSEETASTKLEPQGPHSNFPNRAWKPLSKRCEEIGWTGLYNTLYRVTSEASHGGSNTILAEYFELLGLPRTNEAKAQVLVGAVRCYTLVAAIAAQEFPQAIEIDAVMRLTDSCRNIEEELVNLPPQVLP